MAFTFDIELALLNPVVLRRDLEAKLTPNLLLEDRVSRGWGLVLRAATLRGTTLGEQLEHFLSDVSDVAVTLRSCRPLLRIAVFNRSATCTVTLPHSELLCALGADVEIAVYPTSESEWAESRER